jgi:sugar phosphate isomerase/epimerase
MRFAATTLGCPEWDLPTAIARLCEYGYHGIDFRGLRGNLNVWELPEFGVEAAASAARIRDAGLEVSCFSAGARLVWQSEGERGRTLDEIRRYAELCQQFGAPMIRIFGGGLGEMQRADALARGRESLREWLAVTAGTGVRLVVESHDAWTAGKHLLALTAETDPGQVGLCWDVKHTYWVAEEAPAFTWRQLKDRIVNTHWKDTRRDHASGKDRLCLVGSGVLPLADCLDVMVAGGYAGYFTLEWEKRWHPYIAEPEVAFPAFIHYMRQLRSGLGKSEACPAATDAAGRDRYANCTPTVT